MNILLRAAILVMMFGLALGLPNVDSIFIDFTAISDGAINLMQLGIVGAGLAFFFGGDL